MGPAAIVTVGRAAGVKFWMRPPRAPRGKNKGEYRHVDRERVRWWSIVATGQGLVGA